jgi:hypothetical protein
LGDFYLRAFCDFVVPCNSVILRQFIKRLLSWLGDGRCVPKADLANIVFINRVWSV